MSSTEQTLSIIKPDAVERNLDNEIKQMFIKNGFNIIKISNAIVDHKGWSSHFDEIKSSMNISRVWHFTWSSLYFDNKFCRKSLVLKKITKLIFLCLVKNIFNLLLFRINKFKVNNIKLSACFAFLLNKGSYFRVEHKIKNEL